MKKTILLADDSPIPKMNGLEAARELQKLMPTVPIILLTLHARSVEESFAENLCVDLVVAQGDFKHLMHSVRALLFAEAGITTEDLATI